MLLVPESKEWQISFVANVYYKSGDTYTLVNRYDYSTTYLKAALALVAGNSYNFNITVGGTLNPITFSATTADWADVDETHVTVQ